MEDVFYFSLPKLTILGEAGGGGLWFELQCGQAERTEYLEKKGYRVLKFWNNEVLENMDEVLNVIMDNLNRIET